MSKITWTKHSNSQITETKNHCILIRWILEIDMSLLIYLNSKVDTSIKDNLNTGLENSPLKSWVSPFITWLKKKWITIRWKPLLRRVFWETSSFSQRTVTWHTKKWSSSTPNSRKIFFLTSKPSTHWRTKNKSIRTFSPQFNPLTIPKFLKMTTFSLLKSSLNTERMVDTMIWSWGF